MKVKGIHHISSTVGHAQRNLDFYSGFLGLRLVKQTLNYDDKKQYHLYYGNKDGSTGLATTFPMTAAVEGMIGGGQVSRSIYAVPKGSLEFWKKRFNDFGITYEETTSFNQKRLNFSDLDGLALQLVEEDITSDSQWIKNNITKEQAFIGIQSAELLSVRPEETFKVLTESLGYSVKEKEGNKLLLEVHPDLGGQLELNMEKLAIGRMGKGTVHHLALHVEDDDIEKWRKLLIEKGYHPTEVKDRHYFKALYFREPGGILIELSTTGASVLVDEPLETLGETFIIPKHFEKDKEEIFEEMMPLHFRDVKVFEDYGYRNRYEYEVLQKKKDIKQKISDIISTSKKRSLSEEEKERYDTYRKEYLKIGRGK